MTSFKFFWTTHKWTGIIVAIVLLNMALSGFLLLMKKKFDWIQPPTMTGQKGETGTYRDFISTEHLFDLVLAQDHPDFQSLEDIDRVDFRPGRRVFKVRSEHHLAEMQIDAVSGEVLHQHMKRRSDFLESLHDGSFYGEWAHEWLMPATSICLVFLICSGLYLWIEPTIRKRRRKKRKARLTGQP